MLYPSIDKILNIVDSKYELVHLVSSRAREIDAKNNLQLPEYDSKREIGKALEEIAEGALIVREAE